MPLGVLPDTVYVNYRTRLEIGQILMIGTDGLYEIEDSAGVMLGFENLARQLPRHWSGDLESFIATTFTHLSLIERDRQADDRTMVVLTRQPA